MQVLRASLEDESEPKVGGEGGVSARSFIDSFTSRFTILAAYRAVGAMAEVSYATTEAFVANIFGTVATWTLAF